MLDVLEQQQRLTKNQWKIISAAVLGDMLDFFDYGLIAFALAFIVGQWKLTYGQSAIILLSAGIGAVPGALIWGWLADRIGRRTVFIGTALNFSIFTGLMALTPDTGGWIFLAVMRLFVGAGVSGLFAVDLPLVQEFVPTRKRGWVGGVVTCCLPLGSVLAAILGAYVEPYVGWRGLFAIGLLPAFLTLLIRAWVPESPRWLMRMGRTEEARKSLAWALQVDPAEIELPAVIGEVKRTPYRELFKFPRSMAVTVLSSLGTQAAGNGIGLWAPTLLVLLLKIPPGRASFLMIWVGYARVCRALCVGLPVGCDRTPPVWHFVELRRRGDPRYRRAVSRRFPRRHIGLLVDADGSTLFRRRWLCTSRTIFRGGLARGITGKRHGLRLRPRQPRQDRRSARPGIDCGLI